MASVAFLTLLVAISAWPSIIWINGGYGASCTARRSGAIASARMAAFEQGLAFQLVEIRIVRLALDQSVDLADCLAQVAVTVGGNRPGIARRQAVVGRRITAQHGLRLFQEARQLGAHQVVAKLQFGRVLAS